MPRVTMTVLVSGLAGCAAVIAVACNPSAPAPPTVTTSSPDARSVPAPVAEPSATELAAPAEPAPAEPSPVATPMPIRVTAASQLFDSPELQDLYIALPAAALAALGKEPTKFVRGELRYRDRQLADVGVRLKGNRSMRGLDSKPAFKLHFSKFSKGRKFLDLRTLTLNNLIEDPTAMREHFAYRLFRAAGVPAPRTGYARVFVNDEYFGLYLLVEPVDEEFVATRYADGSGTMFEGEFGCDLYPGDVHGFDMDAGDDDTRTQLAVLAKAADESPKKLWNILNRERVLAYLAVSSVLGDFDGYSHGHNYRIYHEPTRDEWTFIPWGLDRTFKDDMGIYDYGGRVAKVCFADEQCRLDYARAVRRVVTLLEDMDVPAGMTALAPRLESALAADKRREGTDEVVKFAREEMRAFVRARPREMRRQTACIDAGAELDRDGDGYGCTDCRDENAAIHPGAGEMCDGIDNDCSGRIDDGPMCTCPTITVGQAVFMLCDMPMAWQEAADFCELHGARLARLDTHMQSKMIAKYTYTTHASQWWIGLTDAGTEGTFTWADGTPVTYTRWSSGEPDNAGCNQDCVTLSESGSGRWHDKHCATRVPFVCRFP